MASSPFGPLTVIADPRARAALPGIGQLLDERGVEHREAVAESSEDGERLAREVTAAGGRFVAAVGGDAIVHDVVNGLFSGDGPAEPPVLGVIPAGLDNEFFRQFGLPTDVERATRLLGGEDVYPIDVAALTATDERGELTTRFVTNLVEAGFGARMAPWSSGETRLRTFLRFWRSVIASRTSEVHVQAARQTYDGPAWSVVVGNGRFGAGGFRVSPRSFPGDGVLEVLAYHGPRSVAFTSLPKALKGEQVPSPHITELRGNRVRIEADPPMPLAVDGRPFGRTPASVEVRAQALLLKI